MVSILSICHVVVVALAADAPEVPRVDDDRLQIELFADAPQITTPTGIAVTEAGVVLVVENNTHFRPAKYDRAPHDRILAMRDTAGDGKADKIEVFLEGMKNTMSLALFHDGSAFIATRSEIFRVYDKDNDGKADGPLEQREVIVRLETKGDYPHNGLSGFAFDMNGDVYFGFGENLGADYKLIGTDGVTLTGGGEGGNVYCVRPDGSKLRRVATGFWNPFGLGFDAFGRLFCVDNDPDSRPPCRLLHIVEGGDYGFRFRHGRKGVHPLTAWNGELPGTLPMVSGTGEAPCAVMAYESDNLPEEYRGELLVTSWGDHRLERYTLKPRGASFSGEMTPVISGGDNFRPVGLALAPDGSLFMSDWVDKSYQLHGKGRVWRISAKHPPKPNRPDDPIAALSSPHGPWREKAAQQLNKQQLTEFLHTTNNLRTGATVARQLHDKDPEMGRMLAAVAQKRLPELIWRSEKNRASGRISAGDLALQPDWELEALAARAGMAPLVERFSSERSATSLDDPFVQFALARFVSAHRQGGIASAGVAARALSMLARYEWYDSVALFVVVRNDPERQVDPALLKRWLSSGAQQRLLAVRWIADDRLIDFKPALEESLPTAPNAQVLEASLAALEILSDTPRDPKGEAAGADYVAKMLARDELPAALKAILLRSIPANHKGLTVELLRHQLSNPDLGVRLEAIRTLRERPAAERHEPLLAIARNPDNSPTERSEAVVGISVQEAGYRAKLLELIADPNGTVAMEALRAFRGQKLTPDESSAIRSAAAQRGADWKEILQVVLADSDRKTPDANDLNAWLNRPSAEGDAAAGKRLFFSPSAAGCYKCHEHHGRGGKIGPDLSDLGPRYTRQKLVESIVQPSKEIGPLFTPWLIQTKDGESFTGMYVNEEVDGTQNFADPTGKIRRVHPRDIERKKPSSESIMPKGLAEQLTAQELRDLAAFLLGEGK